MMAKWLSAPIWILLNNQATLAGNKPGITEHNLNSLKYTGLIMISCYSTLRATVIVH